MVRSSPLSVTVYLPIRVYLATTKLSSHPVIVAWGIDRPVVIEYNKAGYKQEEKMPETSMRERDMVLPPLCYPSKLLFGRRVNIPGPATFPPWPGQIATVIPGHTLRTNEYLLVKVIHDEDARSHWQAAVIKPQTGSGPGETASGEEPLKSSPEVKPDTQPPSFTTGQLMIIKGTEVSFFIPPTGIEVVRDERGQYVRVAVTLEQLEFCILLDENGNKRYVRGPAVVFPSPTETFVERDGSRKFRALELNPNMGIYVKVVEEYTEIMI
jgi:major vault protein